MSMGFGWRALIAAEMIGGDRGLGCLVPLGRWTIERWGLVWRPLLTQAETARKLGQPRGSCPADSFQAIMTRVRETERGRGKQVDG